ncbi:MAG TPA: TatD family hydrolase [Thermomicrobiales bacterium]|nr:TatD family hydrolase [Thermomicrobiales bacterium]
MAWIDSHVHLDDVVFDGDRERVLDDARREGVFGFVNIGYRPAVWDTTLDLAQRHQDVRFTLGVHPSHADGFTPRVLDRLTELVESSRPVAIGEIGLDFFRGGPPRGVQEEALRQQLRLALAAGLPAVIHQRAAEAELLSLLSSEPELPRLVLHSFDGSDRYADFASERGDVVGVGGLATRQGAAELRHILSRIDPNHVVLETDSPYLVPRGVRERRNSPASIPSIGRLVSSIWSIDVSDLARMTTATASLVFGLVAIQS